MAEFGEHPPIPDSIENLLSDDTVSTAFLTVSYTHLRAHET